MVREHGGEILMRVKSDDSGRLPSNVYEPDKGQGPLPADMRSLPPMGRFPFALCKWREHLQQPFIWVLL